MTPFRPKMLTCARDTCKDIRQWERDNEHTRRLPLVALSANVLGKVSKQCQEAGFDQYLEKPIHYPKLAEVMTEMLGDYRR